LVSSGKARDKQDAIAREDWAAIRRQLVVKVKTVRAQAAFTSKAVAPILVQTPRPQSPAGPPPVKVIERVVSSPAVSAVAEESFPALIGVASKGFRWPRTGLFAVANLVAALLYFSALSATSSLPVDGSYWFLGIWQSVAFSLAAVMAFRVFKNYWMAAVVAAMATLLLILPVYGALPGFAWADILYREQFQQFALLPLVYFFVFLAFESLLVQKLQPLALALWLGAMSAEIITPLFAALLRGLGAKEPPDPVLAGGSLVSAVCRSLVFTAVFWGGLILLSKKNEAATVQG
jgi:hypothetical protein